VWGRQGHGWPEQAWRTAGSWVLAIGRSHVGDWRCSKSLAPHPPSPLTRGGGQISGQVVAPQLALQA